MSRILILTALLLTFTTSCFARGHMWFDKASSFGAAKKFVLFNIEGSYDYPGANDLLYESLQKRLGKEVVVLKLEKNNQETAILEENPHHKYLRETRFPNEAARAKAVKEHANSQYYLVCRVRQNYVEEEYSPSYTETLTLESYTEEIGGPDGYQRYGVSTWQETATVPAATLRLRNMNIDYAVYNNKGQKVFLYQNEWHGYIHSERGVMEKLIKEFSILFREGKKGCGGKK